MGDLEKEIERIVDERLEQRLRELFGPAPAPGDRRVVVDDLARQRARAALKRHGVL